MQPKVCVCGGGHVQNPKSNPKSRRNVPEFQGNALLVHGGRRGVGGGGQGVQSSASRTIRRTSLQYIARYIVTEAIFTAKTCVLYLFSPLMTILVRKPKKHKIESLWSPCSTFLGYSRHILSPDQHRERKSQE